MKKPSTPAATAAARERVQELPRAAARVLARNAVLANRVTRVEHHRIADLVQQIEAARIDDEVVVAERVAALGDDDAVVARVLDLLHGLRHVLGRNELAVLDVHDAARLRGRDDELRLHAQVRRNLDDVDDFAGRRRLIRVVNVGEHRQVELAASTFSSMRRPSSRPGPLVELERAAVVLRERRLEDQRNAQSSTRSSSSRSAVRIISDSSSMTHGPGDQE